MSEDFLVKSCRKTFELKANELKFNWRKTDKDELIKLCIDNKNTELSEAYLSAVILRYWRSIYYGKRVYEDFTYDECIDCYLDSIKKVLTYGVYHMENITDRKHPYNMVVNRCVQNVFENYRVSRTRQMRCVNYEDNRSLDEDAFSEYNEEESPLLNFIASDANIPSVNPCDDLIGMFIKNKNPDSYLNAIFLDRIAYSDSTKDGEFSRLELARSLQALDKKFKDYFMDKYDADSKCLDVAMSKVKYLTGKTYSNGKVFNDALYRKVDKMLDGLKYRSEVRDILCQ